MWELDRRLLRMESKFELLEKPLRAAKERTASRIKCETKIKKGTEESVHAFVVSPSSARSEAKPATEIAESVGTGASAARGDL